MAEEALDRIESSLDRFQEAHFWIHGLESYYHYASHFRWYLNAFLKALNEIPQVLQTDLQNDPAFVKWFGEHSSQLRNDPLIAYLSKQRDTVVHRRMLVPKSTCLVGVTEGRGMKLGLSFGANPREDSDQAMHRYLAVVAARGDFLGILTPDEDSVPCVHRVWRLPSFDEDIVGVCARAWLRTGETITEVIRWLGVEPPPLSLNCRHADQRVQFKTYERDELAVQLRALGGKASETDRR